MQAACWVLRLCFTPDADCILNCPVVDGVEELMGNDCLEHWMLFRDAIDGDEHEYWKSAWADVEKTRPLYMSIGIEYAKLMLNIQALDSTCIDDA